MVNEYLKDKNISLLLLLLLLTLLFLFLKDAGEKAL